MGSTTELAAWVVDTDVRSLPESALMSAESALLDQLTAGLYGSQQEWSRTIARNALRDMSGVPGPVPLYGRSESLPPGLAARVNGAAGHGFELDDVFEPGNVHPGPVVVTAALSASVARETDGRALLAGIIVGYEVLGLMTLAAGSQFTVFHTTGTHGVLGSTAAVGRIAGLSTDELANAWGIATSLASAVKAFQVGGGEIKRLHPGRAAENGVLAVGLGEDGLTAPHDIIENPRGFMAAFGRNVDLGLLVPHPDRLVVENVYVKRYSSGAIIHPVVDSLKTLMSRDGFGADDVKRVAVRTSNRGVAQNSVPAPRDTMGVQYGFESSVALTLLGSVDLPSAYAYETFAASRAPEIAKLVEVVVDDEAEESYPHRMGGGVDVELHDGRVLSAYEPGLREFGTPQERRAMVEEKFRRITSGLLSDAAQDSVIAAVDALKEGGSPGDVARLVGPDSLAARR